MEQESIYDWLWLLLVFGAGSRKIWKLLEQYETPQKVRQVLQTETDLPFIHEREQRSIRSITNEQIGKLMQNCAEKRIELVAYDDENYPESLRQIYNPPVVLFYQGQLSVLSDYPALTVVGTRKPSSYSIRTADLLCRCLAKSGMLLVSGFAVGLDSVAHRAALLSGGKTVAVMGCGLDVPYPKPNASAKKYIMRNGLLLSEFLPGTEPSRQNFPMRNRILAGVSGGTLVIQAPIGSGALITAEQAMEQGKPVFCLPPADIFDNQYAGVVKYLREGAIPVFAPEAILQESISEEQKSAPTVDRSVLETLDPLSKRIMELLFEQSPLHIDQMVLMLQEDAEEVAACLTELAIEQLVQRQPGQYYCVC